jgi:hypothetical protein
MFTKGHKASSPAKAGPVEFLSKYFFVCLVLPGEIAEGERLVARLRLAKIASVFYHKEIISPGRRMTVSGLRFKV